MNATASSPILGYREFLKTRDGEADVYNLSLSRREEFFAHIEYDVVVEFTV